MTKLQTSILGMILFVIVGVFTEYPKFQALNDGKMHIYFLDVGQGDASLIKLPSKKLILIDSGPSSKTVETLSNYLPITANKIDLAILTHSHADHISGFIDVLDNFEVECLVYNIDDPSTSETESHLREKIALLQIKIVRPEQTSECLSEPGIQISNYYIEAGKDAAENQNLESVMTLVKYASFEALFTGDAEVQVQTEILPRVNENIEVLKVPHQGSADSLYPPLLQKLDPDYAIFSVGEDNSYGHPHREVLEEYSTQGINSGRTDLNGTIIVSTDGKSWNIKTSN